MAFLYDTVGCLSQTGDFVSARNESYSVLRHHVTVSVYNTPKVSAEDYFSLDIASSNDDDLPCPSTPCMPAPSKVDRTLERAWFRPNCRFISPMLQLHKEIVDFCAFISPTQEEQASRAGALQCVTQIIKYIWPSCRVEVFGSFKTGLYLPTSDVDVVVLESNVKSAQVGLFALSKALRQSNIANNIKVIAKARVPIIKFVERQSNVAFDVSFDVPNGPKAAEFIKDVLTKIRPLKPLCLILKVFLQQRELNEVYSGGIGSYALLTMLIAHLRIYWREQDFIGCRIREHNLGILLVRFFELYGRKLNISEVGISCNRSSIFFLKGEKRTQKDGRPLLSIEDPQAPDNDIGKNSFNYPQIKLAFAMAHSMLTDIKSILALGPNQSILGTIIRPDSVLLKRKHHTNGEIIFEGPVPGTDEPVGRQILYDHIACNWDIFDEEPLPRGDGPEINESCRKRKSSKAEHPGPGHRERQYLGRLEESLVKSSKVKKWR